MPTRFPVRPAALAAIVVVIVWFFGIDRTLLHSDEGRYAEIAREMAASGDWITPRLNGLKYFEKPPLEYWLTAASFDAFGVGNATARLATAVTTLAAALFAGYAGSRVGGPPFGIGAAAAVAGSVGFAIGGHVLATDGLLTAALTVGLAAFMLAQSDGAGERDTRRWMMVAWTAIAAATLTKGLVGIVIPGATLVLYSLATRDTRVWRRLHVVAGAALFVVLTAPWFVAVSLRNPEFPHFFFVHEHFERYLTTEHRRTGAWWYFVPLLAIGILPWLTIVAARIVPAWRDATPTAKGFSWPRFALVWSAFVFVFFSASGSKLPGYILPAIPPLSLVAAWVVERTPPRRLATLMVPLTALAVAALAVLVFAWQPVVRRFAYPGGIPQIVAAYAPWVLAALAASAAGGIVAIVAWRAGGNRLGGTLALALSSIVAVQLALVGFETMRTTRSSWDILQAARAAADADWLSPPFYQVRMYDQTVPFYLRRTTTVVAFRDELALGLDAEPDKGIASVDEWIRRWDADAQAYALMSPAEYDALAAQRVPMRVLARDERRVVVARR